MASGKWTNSTKNVNSNGPVVVENNRNTGAAINQIYPQLGYVCSRVIGICAS